jgi:hypothetical protein
VEPFRRRAALAKCHKKFNKTNAKAPTGRVASYEHFGDKALTVP